MHPNLATLIAFCDGEAGAGRRRIEKHLAKCQSCRAEMLSIQREKEQLAKRSAMPEIAGPPNLAGVLPAIARWRRNPAGAVALRRRLRWQIETYFGSSALLVVERSGMPVEELLGTTGEMLAVFLGQTAAETVTGEVLSGLECAGSEEWS